MAIGYGGNAGGRDCRPLGSASTRSWKAGEQLLCNLRVLQDHRPSVLHPRADVLVQATNQLMIELLYHDSVRAHDAVDIRAIECWTVEQSQLRKHLTMLFGHTCGYLKMVHLRNGSQVILCIGVIGYQFPCKIADTLIPAVLQGKLSRLKLCRIVLCLGENELRISIRQWCDRTARDHCGGTYAR